ncbi:MAG TPA: molybdopterin cofactor-binding domain-containing protein, partial [Thermomicrobiales bacterium]|nr:molybdopterin cofactor-binding domain-containing protein [Thermomicrobiales bacterium]
MTPDKRTLTNRLSRRTFVKGTGAAAGLTIFWKTGAAARQTGDATPIASPEAGATPEATPAAPARMGPPSDLDAYLRVNEDGTVTLSTGKVEFGQGIATGFVQLIAEELSLPFESIDVIMGHTDVSPFDIGTFGSLSTRMTGPRIRQAGANMRVWLTDLAAEELGVDASTLSLQDGAVVVTDDPGTSVSFADLAAGKASSREIDAEVELKDPSTYTVIGESIPRPDVAHKVNGSLKYGIDASVDGMVWGKIVRPTGFGFTLADIDFSEAESMPGVVGTYREGDFAGLAAETREQAEAAIAKVKATWNDPQSSVTSENIFDYMLETADEGQSLGDDTGPGQDVDIAGAISDPLAVTYRAPYVNHCPIEPRTALVQIGDDRVDVWSSTQDPFTVRSVVANIVGRELDSVVVTPMAAGGAFGSKITPMAEPEAAKLAMAFNRPVKILWSREEEIAHGQYRPAMMINITAGLDADNTISGWQYDLYSTSYHPEGSDIQNGAAADWSADVREIYGISSAKTMWYQAQSPLPPYYWRVNGATTNTWAREVTMDILAERAGLDPVTFRRNHLADNPRMLAVMDAVVEKAGWTPGVGQTGQGFGIALGFDANTYIAQVAKVEVDESTGEILVRHFDVGVDCGLIINPEAVKHQLEGGVVMGTSSTLREIIHFENGQVSNASFAEYAPITMREAPSVDVVFSEDKTNPMSG